MWSLWDLWYSSWAENPILWICRLHSNYLSGRRHPRMFCVSTMNEMKSYSQAAMDFLWVCWPVPLCLSLIIIMAFNHCGFLGGCLERHLEYILGYMAGASYKKGEIWAKEIACFSRSSPLGRLTVVTWECSFEDVGQGQWHFYSPSCTELWDRILISILLLWK